MPKEVATARFVLLPGNELGTSTLLAALWLYDVEARSMGNWSSIILASDTFGPLVNDLSLTCLDVGARKGFIGDLLPIAPLVKAIGFEPDPQECERLNRQASQGPRPWRSLRYLPIALGKTSSERTLHVYRAPGHSSLLEANTELVDQFARSRDFSLKKALPLATLALDEAACQYGFENAVYLKLDVQGAELEVLNSAPLLLCESLLALRVEVELLHLYKEQPLLHHINAHLIENGFWPMGMVDIRWWRRTAASKSGVLPYSRGQLAHADIIYFKDPAALQDDSPVAVRRLVVAALLALAYECIDHAAALLNRPAVRDYLRREYGIQVEDTLLIISRRMGRWYLQRNLIHSVKNLADLLVRGIGLLLRSPAKIQGVWCDARGRAV